MKLTCAVLLVLAGSVSATPHGYGVKGGASSRADASASAGGFGGSGIPVPVPLGASYSGSFSKSSSSSSSSSSASSSSSSSSFSYNGSGVGFSGFGSNDATALGTGGCGSGSCQGAHGISGSHGAGDTGAGQSYNTANAIATAGAVAGTLSVPGCQGSNCNDHSTKCKSGQCKPQLSSEPTKCSSGLCGSGQDDNDIFINTETTKSSHDSKDQTSNSDKKETGYNGAAPDCSTGNCGSSAATKPQLHGTVNSYGTSSSSNNNQHSATSDSDIFTGYHQPASYLETPKFGTSCTSENCGSGPSGTGSLPSSYNVPIHGTYNSIGQKPACVSGNCNPSTNSNSPSTNYLIPQSSDFANGTPKSPSSVQSASNALGAINCAGQSCGTPTNPSQIGHSFTTPSLSQIHSGLPSHSAPSSGSGTTGCKTSDCRSYPSVGLSSGGSKPNYETGPSINKFPEHTAGFSGPTGKPHEFVAPVLSSGPSHSYTSAPSFNTPSIGTTASGCKTPDCAGYTSGAVGGHGVISPSTSFGVTHPGNLHQSTAGATAGADAHFGSFGVTKPITPSKEKLPGYTGGFGAPAGVLKPNEFNAIPGKPGYPHSGPTFTPSPSAGTPSCNTPNCGGYSNAAAAAVAGANAQTGSFNAVKPNTDASSLHEKLPPYTGGFGGPAGVLAPAHGHGSVPHSPSYSHSGIPSTVPSVSVNTAGCKTPNCAGFPSVGAQSSAGANAVSGSYDLNKQTNGLAPASQKLPGYSGGIGTPAGLPTAPASAPVGPAVTHPGSPSLSSSASGPSTTCATPNCAYPNAGVATDAHSFDATKPISELPSYTGGFGGPSGVYKPIKQTSASEFSPSSGGASTECKTPNCASAGYPAGVHKPEDLNVHGNGENSPSYSLSGSPSYSTPTGNSGYHAAGVTAGSNAQSGSFGVAKPSGGELAGGKIPAYIGGFGAPGGVLKPEAPTAAAGTPSFAPTGSSLYNAPSITGTSGCKTPDCGSYPSAAAGAASGAHAQAGSQVVHKPATDNSWDKELSPYTGGFGGPSGLLKPNEYTAPAVGGTPSVSVSPTVGVTPIIGHLPSDLHKPTGPAVNSKPASCTSGACAHHVSSPSSSNAVHTGVSNGAQAVAGASADADAVAYTGGFGGPSGFLRPSEDGKFGAAGVAGKQTIGAQFGSSHAPGGISQHGASGSGSQAISTVQAGSVGLASGVAQAGAVAHAGVAATATSGAISEHNVHGSHSDHSGHGVKGGCSGGCGGSYSGATSFGYSGGLGLSKLGYADGLSGSLSSSGASARSLAGASAFSQGGSFASSSATAHALAGASVKGGYGRR